MKKIMLFFLLTILYSCSSTKVEVTNSYKSYQEFIISSDQLQSLDFDTFKRFGFNDKGDYLMRVRYNGKIVFIGVKTFVIDEQEIITPIFTDKKLYGKLYELLLANSIFFEYNKFVIERKKYLKI